MRIVLDAQDIKTLVSGQLVEKEVINREGDVEQVQIVVHNGPRPTYGPGNHTD